MMFGVEITRHEGKVIAPREGDDFSKENDLLRTLFLGELCLTESERFR
jgi:hypothetical protein